MNKFVGKRLFQAKQGVLFDSGTFLQWVSGYKHPSWKGAHFNFLYPEYNHLPRCNVTHEN